MSDEIELLTDRVNDLESQLVNLSNELENQKESNKEADYYAYKLAIFFTPTLLGLVLLAGFNAHYETDSHRISYNNDSLVELGLGALTLMSGAYSVKKYRDKQYTRANKIEEKTGY